MMCQSSVQQKITIMNTEELHRCMRERTLKLENDKVRHVAFTCENCVFSEFLLYEIIIAISIPR